MRRTAEAATRRRRWTMLTDGGAGSGAQSAAGLQGARGSPGCGLSAPGHVGPGHTRRGVDRGAAGRGAAPRAPTNPKRKHAYTKFSRKEKEFEGKRASRGSGRGVRAASAAAEPGPLVLPPLATLAAHGHGKASLPCGVSTVQTARRGRLKRLVDPGEQLPQFSVTPPSLLRSCVRRGGSSGPRRCCAAARVHERVLELAPSRSFSSCAPAPRRGSVRERVRELAPSRSFASCAPAPRRGSGRGAPPPRRGEAQFLPRAQRGAVSARSSKVAARSSTTRMVSARSSTFELRAETARSSKLLSSGQKLRLVELRAETMRVVELWNAGSACGSL